MTQLDAQFLRAICLMVAFKPRAMVRAEAALLMIGLQSGEFTAADLPGEVGGKHLSGAATGALISGGLLEVVGRIKSPNLNAKGRKLDVLRLTSGVKARAWLAANGINVLQDLSQTELPFPAMPTPQAGLVVHPGAGAAFLGAAPATTAKER